MTLEELQKLLGNRGIHVDEVMLAQFDVYADLLKKWNQKMNLTAIVEKDEVIEKHFYDCLLPLTHLKLDHKKVADVGSGAGFPGLVFAIVCPTASFTLIEPTGKRCTFLKEVCDQLHLKNVEIVNERSEDYAKEHRESFDVVTARAVANLSILSELCIPLIKKGGVFLALKGKNGEIEYEEAKNALKTLGIGETKTYFEALENQDQRVNFVFMKTQSTPSTYPRPYGRIKKRPL